MPPGTVPLTAVDKVLKFVDEHEDTSLATGGILVVNGAAPDLAALRDHVGSRLDQAPVLAFGLDRATVCWKRQGPGFDVRQHVGERVLEPGDDPMAAVLDLPDLSHGRPLWDLTVLHGYAPGEYMVCYRTHHMFQDGSSLFATLEALFGRRRLPLPSVPVPRGGAPVPRGGAPARGRARRTDARESAARTSRLVKSILTDPGIPLRRRVPWLPNQQPVSGDCVFRVVDLDIKQLQEVARAAQATVNQVCLATITGAFRMWTPREWQEPHRRRDLTIWVPVNLRPADRAGALSNSVGVLPVTLACGRSSPREHLRQVMEQTSEQRIRTHRDRGRLLAGTPFPVARRLIYRFLDPGLVSACVSTLRVAPRLSVLGDPVRTVLAVPAMTPIQRLIVAIVQYETSVTVCILAEKSLTADSSPTTPDHLGKLCGEALAALHRAYT
ncbi:wax ester/triacylglycerol synthase domain-containing protein [Actinomadura sp. GTD37]|uniref:wax ester/triacylglycerol synthase domain-containing protein n=1 Tax=Actinomadura sp. GTD37 TaxID=1778030 RepID=UPI0035BF77C1